MLLALLPCAQISIGFVFSEPFELRIQPLVPHNLTIGKLKYWDLLLYKWLDAADSCSAPYSVVEEPELVVHVCHLTQFAIFETYHINHPDLDYEGNYQQVGL
jgi:hypothetical protein